MSKIVITIEDDFEQDCVSVQADWDAEGIEGIKAKLQEGIDPTAAEMAALIMMNSIHKIPE